MRFMFKSAQESLISEIIFTVLESRLIARPMFFAINLSNVSEKGTELGEAGVTGAADVTFLVTRC